MQALFTHIERVREKPHHVRRKVAFATSLSITAVIALLWLGVSLSAGTFALQDSTFADTAGGSPAQGGASGLAGAAAGVPQGASEPRIEIVDAPASQSTRAKPEETVIPF